ncbi:imelysin family protein [Tistrella bauzanensis]|uniref:Imelysin family protein n=1 Tax=Tistrella arctica TaxID=3133430 RepID=A0ABU9YDT9_9PROT
MRCLNHRRLVPLAVLASLTIAMTAPAGAATSTAAEQTAETAAAQAVDHKALAARALDGYIRPEFDGFETAAARLAAAAEDDQSPETLLPLYDAAYDAWMRVWFFRFGPLEAEGRRFRLEFWPERSGIAYRAISALVRARNPIVDDPDAFAGASAGAQNLVAMERLLRPRDAVPAAGTDGAGYRHRLIRAMARNLAREAAAARAGWDEEGGAAFLLMTAGAEENMTYFTPDEATFALFNAFHGALQELEELRLGAVAADQASTSPRAAHERAGASLENIRAGIGGLIDFERIVFAPAAIDQMAQAAMAASLAEAARAADAAIAAGPADIAGIAALKSALADARGLAVSRLAPALGVRVGFNSFDGD